MTHHRAAIGLIVTAMIWGASFTVVKGALADITPMLFVGIRFALAVMLIALALRGLRRPELRAGLVLGLLFWGGYVFQTIGIQFTTPARSAFITALSTPLVPVVAWLVTRKRPGWRVILAVVAASVGLYHLTDPGGGGPNRGDLLTIGCAVLFAGHIVAVGRDARAGVPIRLLGIQFAVTSLLSFLAAPLTENPHLTPSPALLFALGFLVLTAVGTFWFQLRAQQVLTPSETALIFALEPFAAVLTSYLVLGEVLTAEQWLGGLVVVGAVVWAAVGEAGGRAADARRAAV